MDDTLPDNETGTDHEPASKPLEKGNAAFDFALQDSTGRTRTLSELRVTGPVVLVFYHGSWCESCRAQLSRLQQRQEQFAALGTNVAGVSADSPTKSARLAESLTLGFPLLSDPNLTAARGFGVTQAVGGLSLAAIFVVDREGLVQWAHVGEGSPVEDQILDEVRALGAKSPTQD